MVWGRREGAACARAVSEGGAPAASTTHPPGVQRGESCKPWYPRPARRTPSPPPGSVAAAALFPFIDRPAAAATGRRQLRRPLVDHPQRVAERGAADEPGVQQYLTAEGAAQLAQDRLVTVQVHALADQRSALATRTALITGGALIDPAPQKRKLELPHVARGILQSLVLVSAHIRVGFGGRPKLPARADLRATRRRLQNGSSSNAGGTRNCNAKGLQNTPFAGEKECRAGLLSAHESSRMIIKELFSDFDATDIIPWPDRPLRHVCPP